MGKPTQEDIERLGRYFAIEHNNKFWSLSEVAEEKGDQLQLLEYAFGSLSHWKQVGTQDNIELANLAVARALAVNHSALSVEYAQLAYDHFDGKGANWIQAFTNAVLSHALLICGKNDQAALLYQQAESFRGKLDEGDLSVFDATFQTIPQLQIG
ncbi:hypothetical protein [Photobacterium lutimaris]|uniref:Uncharacterized protein n=1 Tax=Photobacterium lutimaris TaxID=388278 RepID=A0A2T3IY63_9GAMM|nr:hypothetical protein [Photobacterium lutimaris]PSU33538.1 hypothetical protein C9I99_12225 [Photobacterium lutimaris]TDR74626.1 hypothetical protein DFP78_107214 [Photobacterium lutimaris]